MSQLWGYNAGMKKGKIIPNGVVLEKHEYQTVLFFTELGFDVELVPKSNKLGERSPDIKMGNLLWEMKCPKGQGKYLIQNTLHKAADQSENIIIDLRRIKIYHARCMARIEKEFRLTRRIRRIKVVTKTKNIIDFQK